MMIVISSTVMRPVALLHVMDLTFQMLLDGIASRRLSLEMDLHFILKRLVFFQSFATDRPMSLVALTDTERKRNQCLVYYEPGLYRTEAS